jgi:hypothetical protein
MSPLAPISQSQRKASLTIAARLTPPLLLHRNIREPSQYGWRRFLYFLFIYMTFEGLLRRSLPLYNLQILLLKDVALFLFYAYFLLCAYPTLPKWPNKDKMLIFLTALFVAVNAIGIVRAGPGTILPVIIGLKANFWYVPLFFIGRRYFVSYRQIREFWYRLAWLLVPVAAVAIWQVLFGQFNAYVIPTGAVDSESWAAAGAGTLRNNTDGTLIATVASTFFGGRLAVFAAIWLLFMIVLCITNQTKASLLRLPYLYVTLACAMVAIFVSANRTAVGLTIICIALLLASERGRHSFRFLARAGGIAVLAVMLIGAYRATSTSDVLEDQFRAFTSFFSGLLDAPGADIRGSRYSVVGADIVRGIELSLAEVGLFGRGLGLITQGTIYITGDAQPIFDVQRSSDAQADSQWVRLVIELGIPGLLLYLAIAFRLLWRLAREALRVRRRSWMDGLTVALAPILLLLYLGFAHKHAGFAVDPMFQCYVYFAAGATLGVSAREGVRQEASAWGSPVIQASLCCGAS